MNFVERLKKEPRIYMALVIFISFFFNWVEVGVSVSVGSTSRSSGKSYTGFDMAEGSGLAWILFAIPIIMIVCAFIEQLMKYYKIIYPVLSAIIFIFMFRVGSLYSAGASAGGVSAKAEFSRSFGFWIALIANIAIVIYTLIRDFNFSSTDKIKDKMGDFSTDGVSSMAKGITSKVQGAVQDVAFVECSNCGNKVVKGKKFCGKCGNKMPEIIKTEANAQSSGVNAQSPGVNAQSPKVNAQGPKVNANTLALKCPKCGRGLPEGAVFCDQCGTRIPQKTICPSCGAELSKDAKFCIKCGTKIGE
ncbi:MAG: zinc ribbon domain-containing protein [Lachnospiraceae bacterium]|nr:zinc ribbon domain-containing protein [Lachnospiraceae bacterium]